MRLLFKAILLFLLLLQACGNKYSINRFSSSNDTLIIRTQKQMGDGLFGNGVGSINLKDTAETFPYPIVYPKHLPINKRFQIWTDFKADSPNYIDGIAGMRNGKKIFVLDENNNRDLTDDSIRSFEDIKWHTNKGLIKCRYLISDGEKMVRDSSWVRIGNSINGLSYGRSEHLTANFSIGAKSYQISANDFWSVSSFVYDTTTEIALTAEGNTIKDTLFEKDKLKVGEYLKLDKQYYRFNNISNNGGYVTLVKEKDFKNKIGTQVGMLAPDFKAIRVNGDTIDSKLLHDKPIIIANSCGCGNDTISTEAYYTIKKLYGDQAHVIRLDSKIEKGPEGMQIDMETAFNKDMYDNYRSAYCSRICYVIGTDSRIIDKFTVTDWKSALPGIIKP